MRGDAGDMYRSGSNVDEEQDVMRDETLGRADFDTQKVRRRQTLPVSLQKRRPSGVCIALRSRLDPVLLQYAGNAAMSNLMSQIGQRASNSRVSRRRIFKRHLENEIDDRFHDAWPAWAATVTVVPLGGH